MTSSLLLFSLFWTGLYQQ